MDASLQSRVEQLATEFASEATTVEELNGLIRLMMKSGLERMLDTEMDVHLGRRSAPTLAEFQAAQAEPSASAAGEKREARPAQSPQRAESQDGARRCGRGHAQHAA
jgi:putative transposase